MSSLMEVYDDIEVEDLEHLQVVARQNQRDQEMDVDLDLNDDAETYDDGSDGPRERLTELVEEV